MLEGEVHGRFRGAPPQGNAELMTEKKVLGLKPAPRLEQIGDRHCKQVEDRKHRRAIAESC
jgi:hypothetical protein